MYAYAFGVLPLALDLSALPRRGRVPGRADPRPARAGRSEPTEELVRRGAGSRRSEPLALALDVVDELVAEAESLAERGDTRLVHERPLRTNVRPGERAVVLVDDALRKQTEQLLDALTDAGAPARRSGARARARRRAQAARPGRTPAIAPDASSAARASSAASARRRLQARTAFPPTATRSYNSCKRYIHAGQPSLTPTAPPARRRRLRRRVVPRPGVTRLDSGLASFLALAALEASFLVSAWRERGTAPPRRRRGPQETDIEEPAARSGSSRCSSRSTVSRSGSRRLTRTPSLRSGRRHGRDPAAPVSGSGRSSWRDSWCWPSPCSSCPTAAGTASTRPSRRARRGSRRKRPGSPAMRPASTATPRARRSASSSTRTGSPRSAARTPSHARDLLPAPPW